MGLAIAGYQTDVANVGDVVIPEHGKAPAKQRLDDPAHTRLPELVKELVKVSVASQNKALPRFQNSIGRYRSASVTRSLVSEAGLVRQGVHQPGLAIRQFPERGHGIVSDHMAGFRRMLTQQAAYLALREVA